MVSSERGAGRFRAKKSELGLPELRALLGGESDVFRNIRLPAVRHRRKVRAVRFRQNPVGGHRAHRVQQSARVFEGRAPAEAEVETQRRVPPDKLRAVRVTVQYAAVFETGGVPFQNLVEVLRRLSRVENHGEFRLLRERELCLEGAFLDFALRFVVVVVETDFAECDDLRLLAEREKAFRRSVIKGLRVVRVDSHRRIDSVVFFRERSRRLARRKVVAHRHSEFDSVAVKVRNDCAGVRVVLVGQVRVRVDIHFQRTTDPEAIAESGETRESLPSASSAQRIMPSLVIPRSFAGFRLETSTTRLPDRSSGA